MVHSEGDHQNAGDDAKQAQRVARQVIGIKASSKSRHSVSSETNKPQKSSVILGAESIVHASVAVRAAPLASLAGR
jgi:hypothetical protein